MKKQNLIYVKQISNFIYSISALSFKLGFIFFTLLSSTIFGQSTLKNQIVDNYYPVETIDPLQTDFCDIQFLSEIIGDAEIVFLGEQDHGDAPTFLTKIRIIKFLHEKMNFDVLVFESDFYGLNKVSDKYSSDPSLINQLKQNIYSVWTECEQTSELFNYIKESQNSGNPLLVSGMDCRHVLGYTREFYLSDLVKFLNSVEIFTNDSASKEFFIKTTESLIIQEYDYIASEETRSHYYKILDTLDLYTSDLFQKQELVNLRGFAENSWSKPFKSEIRDRYMAKNLLWLYNYKYKGQKIIVWAHSSHSAKNINLIQNYVSTSVGNEVFNELGSKVVVIGFTSSVGSAGRVTNKYKFEVPKPKKKSLEFWLSECSYEYGFVDFTKVISNERFFMKGVRHKSDKAVWNEMFDVVFYIKTMYPCDSVKNQ